MGPGNACMCKSCITCMQSACVDTRGQEKPLQRWSILAGAVDFEINASSADAFAVQAVLVSSAWFQGK